MDGADSAVSRALALLGMLAIGGPACSQPSGAAAAAKPAVAGSLEIRTAGADPEWGPPEPPMPVGVSRMSGTIACELMPPRPDASASDAPDAAAPDPTKPHGRLDKEIIRRVIRRHVPAIKACYQAAMGPPPYAQGRVFTRFAIAPDGKVRSSCLIHSTLEAPQGEVCIIDEILHWEFPKPLGGGWVIVAYPFVLTPE